MGDFFRRPSPPLQKAIEIFQCHKLTSQRREMERGQKAPAIVAFINLRPQLQSITTLISIKQNRRRKQNPRAQSRVCALPISNGASPIASALGIRLGATPTRT